MHVCRNTQACSHIVKGSAVTEFGTFFTLDPWYTVSSDSKYLIEFCLDKGYHITQYLANKFAMVLFVKAPPSLFIMS